MSKNLRHRGNVRAVHNGKGSERVPELMRVDFNTVLLAELLEEKLNG